MSLNSPIAGKRIPDQVTLVRIFIAYLKLQQQKDPQYRQKDIEEIIAKLEHGIGNGLSAFLGHKLLRGKFQEALAEINKLNIFKKIGFNQDITFKDNGDFLMVQGKKFGAPKGEELNRKYNPMVALLEDILSNMRWLETRHEIPLKELWEGASDHSALMQKEWDKLINFVVGEETPKLQHHFSLHSILKKEEVEDIIQQVLSSLESTKMIRLVAPPRTVLVYKEGENYYFSDPNNGRLLGPYTKDSANELTSLILKLLPGNTPHFEFAMDVFGDPIKSQQEKPLDAAKMISELLKKREKTHGSNLVNISNDKGLTSLHLAAMSSHLSIVQELLKNKADLNANASYGMTPLHLAAVYGHHLVVQELLKNKANVEGVNKNKQTALHLAAWSGNLNVVRVLLKNNANVAALTSEGDTALHLAAKNGHFDVVKELLAAKANINLKNKEGKTALQIAKEGKHANIVKILAAPRPMIAGKQILDQTILIPIFIAYLKLQLQKDLEKKAKNPHYIPQYHEKDIQAIIAQIKVGICSGFSAFLGHKLLHGKFHETLAEIAKLRILKSIAIEEEFVDNGNFLISHKNPDTPIGEELNRKYNPMVALLEDILSNMRWLQGEHEITFRDIWDEYEFSPTVNKEFISILSEEPISTKNLMAFCQKNFQIEEGELAPEIFNKEKMVKLKAIFQKSGEKSALRYLDDQMLKGALEKSVAKEKDLRTTVMQTEWDKLINFVIGEETPKLQLNFIMHSIFKKEEIEDVIQQVLSSLESTKILRLRVPNHALLVYKEDENYYFSDPNDGRLLGPYTKESANELSSLIFKLFPEDTANFEFGIDVFGDPIKSKLDKPLDADKMFSELLIKRKKTYGEDLINISNNRWTALHVAAWRGHLKVLEELLANKADVGTIDNDGWIALHIAAEYGHRQIVQKLLENKSNIDAITPQGSTALHLAAVNGHHLVVQELLNSKANIAATNKNKETPLHLAAWKGHLNVVRVLLEKDKSSLTAVNLGGNTPLHLAALNGHPQVIQELLKAGANSETPNSSGKTALYLAAEEGQFLAVQELLKRKANVETTNKNGYTALHMAALRGDLNIVQILIENSAKVEATNMYGDTPLHLAARNGHLKVVQELLKNGAKLESTNLKKETTLDVATRNDQTEVVKYLKQIAEARSSEVEPAGSKTPRKP